MKIHYCCANEGYLTAVPNEYHARRRKAFIIPPFSLKKLCFSWFSFYNYYRFHGLKKNTSVQPCSNFQRIYSVHLYIFAIQRHTTFSYKSTNYYWFHMYIFIFKYIILYIDLEIHIIFLYSLCYTSFKYDYQRKISFFVRTRVWQTIYNYFLFTLVNQIKSFPNKMFCQKFCIIFYQSVLPIDIYQSYYE